MANRRCVVEEVDDDLKFVLREGDLPKTPKNGVLVKVMHAGICHSDVHMSEKNFADLKFPMVFGHETSGTVEDIGEDAAKGGDLSLAKGDCVIVYPWGSCNACPVCRSDSPLCLNQVIPGTDKPLYVYGVRMDGGFQNYMAVDDIRFIVKVPEGVPMDVASLVPCSGITALNSCRSLKEPVDQALKATGKAMVGFFGAGGLALWAIQIMKAMYPENVTVVAVDVVEEKLEDAKAQGADLTYKWGVKDQVKEVAAGFLKTSGGVLLDGAIDFTGIPSVQERIFSIINVGSTVGFVGLGNGKLPNFPLLAIILKAITLKGIYTGNIAMCRDMLDLLKQKKVKPPPITAVRLEDIGDSVQKMRENKIRGRHIVKMATRI